MSTDERYRAALRTLERLSAPAPEQEQEKAPPRRPEPVTPEQVAQAQGAAMLARVNALEAERWRVSVPLIGGGR